MDKNGMIWFFAGGGYNHHSASYFITTFIDTMSKRLGDRFRVVQDVYFKQPFLNVAWALTYGQKPMKNYLSSRFVSRAVQQITHQIAPECLSITLVSSSFGSIAAAQTACVLCERILASGVNCRIRLVFGASMLSKASDLYQALLDFQKQGVIAQLIYDELQDEGDNINGLCGTNRWRAYLNGLGVVFPRLSRRFSGPSFMDKDPETGHIHRRRAASQAKVNDFVRVILREKPAVDA